MRLKNHRVPWAILVAALTVIPLMAQPTPIFFEDFSSGLGSWTVIDGGEIGSPMFTWSVDNPCGRNADSDPPLALMTEPFAIVDSDCPGSVYIWDDELISPAIDTTSGSTVMLRFKHYFKFYVGGPVEVGEVKVRSTATNHQWVTIATFTGASDSGVKSFDITPYSGPDVQINFHYYDAVWEWFWAVDDVEVTPLFIFSDGFESGDTSAWSSSVP